MVVPSRLIGKDRHRNGRCKDQSCCGKHEYGIPVPHHELRKCCGLGGCGPHGCNCFCGVSCHGPLCNCPKEYGYFLCHPQPQYPYTQPDYDGAAGLKKLSEQCCPDCPPYFTNGFPLTRGCKRPVCNPRRCGIPLKKVTCDYSEALAEAQRRKQFFTRIKKPCGGCMEEGCENCEQETFDILVDTFMKAKRKC